MRSLQSYIRESLRSGMITEKKLITKKMIKEIDLNDEEYGEIYQDIIEDINVGLEVDYMTVYSDEEPARKKYREKYNMAVSDILLMLLYIDVGEWSKNAREDMRNVMYKYKIATGRTAEQNLRSLDWASACGQTVNFKISATLNSGLNHFDITLKK